MSLQHKLLAGTALITLFSAGFAQSVHASPIPGQTEGQLISEAMPVDITTRVPGEIETVFGTEYVRVQLPNGESRLVAIPDDAFVTRRLIPGSDVILTMRGNRIVDMALASDADLLALEEEMRARETVVQAEVSAPETIVQTERVEQERVVQRSTTQQTQQTQVVTPVSRPVRAMW